MELVTISQMQKADKHTIEALGVPGVTLMHRAATAIFSEVQGMAAGKKSFSVAVFCGPGNNGGDGWAVASILKNNDIRVVVFSGCNIDKLMGDAAFFANQAVEKGVTVLIEKIPDDISKYDVVIDALFGIGLQREVSGIYKDYILLMNNKAKRVISADIPSGLHSDEGTPFHYAVRADITVTFGRAKTALLSQPGCTYAGKVIVNDIDIPDKAYQEDAIKYIAMDSAFVRERIKPREKISSKGNYGKVLLITGSPGMTGATGLCAEACLRSGTGLVYCAVPKSKIFEYDSLVREAISVPVDGNSDFVSAKAVKDIKRASIGKSSIVIGPGLSEASDSHIIFSELMASTDIPVIADAQVINDLSVYPEILKKARHNSIFTPHPGEMSRLTGKSIEHIQENRIKTAVAFAREHGVIVLLKGHRTLITDGLKVYINTTGNPGMATAGSGDVLCGIIASCMAIIEDVAEAVAAAAYIHGAAGDRASFKYGEYSMKSGDIIAEIPWVMKNISGV